MYGKEKYRRSGWQSVGRPETNDNDKVPLEGIYGMYLIVWDEHGQGKDECVDLRRGVMKQWWTVQYINNK